MSNIEEDIKRLKAFNPGDEYTEKIKTAIQNILAEREQDKKRIKELEEENRIFKDSNVLVNRYFKLKDNSIPVQKVKDKIEKLKTDLRFIACNKDCSKCFNKEGKALYRESDFIFCYAYHQIKILQKLLENK